MGQGNSSGDAYHMHHAEDDLCHMHHAEDDLYHMGRAEKDLFLGLRRGLEENRKIKESVGHRL